VAETQEPATDLETEEVDTPEAATQHPMAETREPATNFGSKETETLAAATQYSEAETQQPATDIDIEIQELEVEGAEALSPLPGNSPPKPYLVPPLQMLKLRLLTGGMNMQKYKDGRRSMLRYKINNCKYTGKPGGITLS
jgi:hypothetical protein